MQDMSYMHIHTVKFTFPFFFFPFFGDSSMGFNAMDGFL